MSIPSDEGYGRLRGGQLAIVASSKRDITTAKANVHNSKEAVTRLKSESTELTNRINEVAGKIPVALVNLQASSGAERKLTDDQKKKVSNASEEIKELATELEILTKDTKKTEAEMKKDFKKLKGHKERKVESFLETKFGRN